VVNDLICKIFFFFSFVYLDMFMEDDPRRLETWNNKLV